MGPQEIKQIFGIWGLFGILMPSILRILHLHSFSPRISLNIHIYFLTVIIQGALFLRY